LPGFPSVSQNLLEVIDLMTVDSRQRLFYPGGNDPNRVSSHNDLNINNVLYDGQRVWISDWEAAFPIDA